MSDSPRHGRKQSGALVKPQTPSERSFMENMAGLINEVVPQAYGSPGIVEAKEEVLWCKFERLDQSSYQQSPHGEPETNGNSPPIVLIIGYAKGYQIWAILANGDAQEVVSLRQGKVRCLKILPKPERTADRADAFSHRRPIVAICDSHGIESNLSTAAFTSITFISLRTGETIKTIKFKNPVVDILANARVVVATFPEKAAIFDSCTFEDRFVLTNCYLSPGANLNPIALGHRWLAYAEKKLSPVHKSGGGFEGEGVHSYTATVIHAAKSITKGLREMGGTLASSLIGQKSASPPHPSAQAHPGIVTVVDLRKVGKGEVSLVEEAEGIVAHFIAHSNEPIAHLQFDNSGMLLFTADKQGRNFHIFKILPHPCSSVQSSVHHLYTLYRGDTSAKIHDVSFTIDCRWVSVSTHRGTVHIFPITPYGGAVSVRTHTSQKVVNRLSRFQRSAGLDEKVPSGSSPIFSQSPGISKLPEVQLFGLGNPRLPPFPAPTIVTPLAQIRQPMSISSPSRMSPGAPKSRHSSEDDLGLRVSVCFAAPRTVPPQFTALPGATVMTREKTKAVVDSLFVMSSHGMLVEYCLEPKVSITVPREKINEESPIDLDYHPISQWNLLRLPTSPDLPLPLSSTCLSILSPIKTPGDPGNLLMSTWARADDEAGSTTPESWLSQVEITTYAGPHRRLWMGPQFTFRTIQAGSGSDSEPTEIELTTPPPSNAKSTPVNMPRGAPFSFEDFKSSLPMVIEAGGSCSSLDQSPRLSGMRMSGQRGSASSVSGSVPSADIENQLQENIADAMMDCGALSAPAPGSAVVHFYAENGGSSSDSPATPSLGGYIARPCEFRPIRESELIFRPTTEDLQKRGQPMIRKDFSDVFDDFGTSPEMAEIFRGAFPKSICPVTTGIEAAMVEGETSPVGKWKNSGHVSVPVEVVPSTSGSCGVLNRALKPDDAYNRRTHECASLKEGRTNKILSPAIFPDEFDRQDLEVEQGSVDLLREVVMPEVNRSSISRTCLAENESDSNGVHSQSESCIEREPRIGAEHGQPKLDLLLDFNTATQSGTEAFVSQSVIGQSGVKQSLNERETLCDQLPVMTGQPKSAGLKAELSDLKADQAAVTDGNDEMSDCDEFEIQSVPEPVAKVGSSDSAQHEIRNETIAPVHKAESTDSDEFEIRLVEAVPNLCKTESSDSDDFEIRPEQVDNDVSCPEPLETERDYEASFPDRSETERELPELLTDFFSKESSEARSDIIEMTADAAVDKECDIPPNSGIPLSVGDSPLGIVNENYCAMETGDLGTHLVKMEGENSKSDESDKVQEEEEDGLTAGNKPISRKQKRKGKKKK